MYKRVLWAIAISLFMTIGIAPAGEFPDGPGNPSCPDKMPTGAIFKIILIDGTKITVELQDDSTVVGRSDPHIEGDAADEGAEICGGGEAPYPNTDKYVPDACRKPAGWSESPATRREVHTEILSFKLQGGGITVKAGQPFYDAVASTPEERFFRNSFGEVASEYAGDSINHNLDFPAKSYFNVFVEVTLDISGWSTKLYNKSPMLLLCELTQFPPDFGLPSSTYIHDPSFGPVALYDKHGKLIAYLTSAGHGSDNIDLDFPDLPNAWPFLCPVSFCVDEPSQGVNPYISGQFPNSVYSSYGSAAHSLTVFLSSGAIPGNPPDGTNTSQLPGSVPGFEQSDNLNSISWGRDGTRNPYTADNVCTSHPGALYFSVGRNSTGASCTDVFSNATNATVDISEAAADIFASRVSSFGWYKAVGGILPPANDNVLVVDNPDLGLRPTSASMQSDNVTALELSELGIYSSNANWVYASFTGPSFNGSTATIYVYDPQLGGPFQPANLTAFSQAGNLGLVSGDVIDALAVSDVSLGNICPPSPNRVMNANLDEVLFSLAPGSPTLAAQGLSPADILYSDFDGSFSVFTQAVSLGLLAADDVDAIDIKPIPPPFITYSSFASVTTPSYTLTLNGDSTETVRLEAIYGGGRYPYSFALAPNSDALPAGLSLNNANGTISGEPTAATNGPREIIVRITDSDGYWNDGHIIIEVLPAFEIDYTSPQYVTRGQLASILPTITGGAPPYYFYIANGYLPYDLALDGATGEIAGILYDSGSYVVTIGAYDNNGSYDQASVTIIVEGGWSFSYTNPLLAVRNQYNTLSPIISGSPIYPLYFNLNYGELPPGMSLNNSSGIIYGTPDTVGYYMAWISGYDNYGWTAYATAQITVIQQFTSGTGDEDAGTTGLHSWPNPMYSQARIEYEVPRNGAVHLSILDQLGRTLLVVVDAVQEAGFHSTVIDARNLSPGIYYIRLQAGDTLRISALIVIK